MRLNFMSRKSANSMLIPINYQKKKKKYLQINFVIK